MNRVNTKCSKCSNTLKIADFLIEFKRAADRELFARRFRHKKANFKAGTDCTERQFGNNSLLLTEREGRTGEYWPEVVAVRIERSEVRTKTT